MTTADVGRPRPPSAAPGVLHFSSPRTSLPNCCRASPNERENPPKDELQRAPLAPSFFLCLFFYLRHFFFSISLGKLSSSSSSTQSFFSLLRAHGALFFIFLLTELSLSFFNWRPPQELSPPRTKSLCSRFLFLFFLVVSGNQTSQPLTHELSFRSPTSLATELHSGMSREERSSLEGGR